MKDTIEMLKQRYKEAYEANIKFTEYSVYSAAGYYLTEHVGTELRQLKWDLEEGYLPSVIGNTVKELLACVLKDRGDLDVLYGE